MEVGWTEDFSQKSQTIEEIENKINEIKFNYDLQIEKSNKNFIKQKRTYLEEIQKLVEGKIEDYPKIPSFWCKVLKGSYLFHKGLTSQISITNEDEDCLTYLKKITIEEKLVDGYIETMFNFHFEKGNPYFMNDILTKKISKKNFKDYQSMMNENLNIRNNTIENEDIETFSCLSVSEKIKIEGTKIYWKNEKNLQMKKSYKRFQTTTRSVNKPNMSDSIITVPCESFFNFFLEFEIRDEICEAEHLDILKVLKDEVLEDPLYYYLREENEKSFDDDLFEDQQSYEDNEDDEDDD